MRQISLSTSLRTSQYWSRLVGVRWQFIISILVFWAATIWLKNEYGQDDSNLWLVMQLFLQLLKWTLVGIVILSLLSVLATWAHFMWAIKNKSISLQVKFGDGQKAEAGLVPLHVQVIGFVLRPLLGTIRAQLLFAGNRLSDVIVLDGSVRQPRQLWRKGIRGGGTSLLHDRGIYDVEKVLFSFCDMLGLVALPYQVSYTQQLYTLPLPQKEQRIRSNPNATEEQKHRIEIPKRVEGEHVNYKEFETGDNIQRIVWKIYAKSGQLVVRIPEIKDPYASHLYFYASFYNGLSKEMGVFERELLNVYKDQVRNVFESLKKNDYEIRMPLDQEIPRLSGVSEKKNELFQITASTWQQQLVPSQFIMFNKAAFVCFSSLTPVAEIESCIKKLPDWLPVVVVKLSETIPSPFQFSVKDVFFKPEETPADKLKQPWIFSSLRKELIKNEKEIGDLLKRRGNSWLTTRIEFEK
ncbi:MAG: DUF58 domain-containing protein [Cyclobacteriaceae bacterium]|nr:DUF58 domain-containing protein [Cyclobacteriaceae bacterium]